MGMGRPKEQTPWLLKILLETDANCSLHHSGGWSWRWIRLNYVSVDMMATQSLGVVIVYVGKTDTKLAASCMHHRGQTQGCRCSPVFPFHSFAVMSLNCFFSGSTHTHTHTRLMQPSAFTHHTKTIWVKLLTIHEMEWTNVFLSYYWLVSHHT